MYRIWRWFAVVLPPSWMVLLLLLFYGAWTLAVWYVGGILGSGTSVVAQLRDMRAVVVAAGFAVFGLFRVGYFHPVFQKEYCEWLARTPWTFDKPFPKGPVHLMTQDVVLVLIGLALTWGTKPNVFVVWAFLFAYLLVLCASLFFAGVHGVGYSTLLAMGLAMRLAWVNLWISAAWLVVCYGLGFVGLRRSLEKFPWDEELSRVAEWRKNSGLDEKRRSESALGWPYDLLSPQVDTTTLSARHVLVQSLLIVWWGYALFCMLPNVELKDFIGGLSLFSLLAAFLRLLTYCSAYFPPINIWGRLCTFRWIVPKYDYVCLTPLCTIFAGPLVASALHFAGAPFGIYVPAGCATLWAVSLLGGPSLASWQLTGHHRLNTAAKKSRGLVEV